MLAFQLLRELVRAAGGRWAGRSCAEERVRRRTRSEKGSVEEAGSGEGREPWQSALLTGVVCCNGDSSGSAASAVSGLRFTFPTNLVSEVSHTRRRVSHRE